MYYLNIISLRPFTLLQISGVKKKRPRITSVFKLIKISPRGYGHLFKKETETRSFSSDNGEFFLYMKLQFYAVYKLIIYIDWKPFNIAERRHILLYNREKAHGRRLKRVESAGEDLGKNIFFFFFKTSVVLY
jgi:hypothetical protein